VRLYLRLVTRCGGFSDGQYENVATMVAEIGRLLGGSQRASRSCSPSMPHDGSDG
jgi:hypothetical protein